jgi:hypothetical protein
MTKPHFITLTNAKTDTGVKYETKISVRADHITGWMLGIYGADSRGTYVDTIGAIGAYFVTETPEQIDALLGVMPAQAADLAEIAAMALVREAARLRDEAEGIHNGTMRGDKIREADVFRKAAGFARAAITKATGTASPASPAVTDAPKAVPYYDLFAQMSPEVVRICASAIGAARLETFRPDIERCELDGAVDAARLAYDRMTQAAASPSDDERMFEARQMLGDIRAHAAGMK